MTKSLKPTDLMTGNWVVTPTPIDSEWLKKFGFEQTQVRDDDNGIMETWVLRGIINANVWKHSNGDYEFELTYSENANKYLRSVINNIHDLQNAFNIIGSGEKIYLLNNK